ncbi:MAG: S1C family serine protease [bacterium]
MSQHDDGYADPARTAVYPPYGRPDPVQPTYEQPTYEQPTYDRQAYDEYWARQYASNPYSSSAYGTTAYAAPSTPRHSRGGGNGGKVALAVTGAAIVAIVAGTIGGAVGFTAARLTAPAPAAAVAAPAAPLGGSADAPSLAANGSIAAVAQAVQPSVVQINVGEGEGTGSGFIIQEDGYILTNHHVAGGGGALSVTFSDGETAEAELVGSSPGYDLAVIKVAESGLPAVALGSSGALQVGDTTIAIGSPLGLQGTVTSGIVSALNRPVSVGGNGQGDTAFINAIQTDAAINPGNSGGPLVDGNGAVIGVNSAIMSMGNGMGGGAGSIGLGFAIPIDTAQRIASELISTGSSATPIIGVQLAMDFDGPGARVADVSSGGPAAAAGLLTDDVIVELNGVPVQDATDLIVDIRSLAPGETVTVTVERGGQERTFDLTLAAQE